MIPFGKVAQVVAICAALGLGRQVWQHAVAERGPRWDRSDARYVRLRPLLPQTGEVGYVSDVPAATLPGDLSHPDGTGMYQQIQYAVAPVVLRYDDAASPLVVASAKDPARLPALLAARGLVVVQELGDGLAVARPAR